MNEHGYIRSIHRLLPPELLKWKIHDNYAGGVPDCFYAGAAGQLWVEYKWVSKLPTRPETVVKPKLSAQQLAWLIKMSGLSIPCAVIIGSPDGGLLLQYPSEWSQGLVNKEVRKRLRNAKQIAKKLQTLCMETSTNGKTHTVARQPRNFKED